MDPTNPQNLEDYSSAATTVQFPHPIALLRGPIPGGPPEDRSYVLAFKSPKSWASAYASSVSQITQQCEEGSRIACAVTASNNCKPAWWRNFIGRRNPYSPLELKDREACELREMEACFAAAKEKCAEFARDKCRKPFMDARIAVGEKALARRLVCLASVPKGARRMSELGGVLVGDTSCRARELLGSDANYEAFLHWRS